MLAKIKNVSGFTLIELLVVIAILALLASLIIVATNNTRQKAQAAKVQADFHQIQTQIDIARDSASKTVMGITGNGCSDCSFRNGLTIKSNPAGIAGLNSSWAKLGFQSPPTDPWGDPYMLDENEQEGGPNDCRYDQVWSAGSNGIDDQGSGDDVSYQVTHFVCP